MPHTDNKFHSFFPLQVGKSFFSLLFYNIMVFTKATLINNYNSDN